MRIPPYSVIDHWPTPDYTDPVTHGPAILVVNIIFITLVLIAFVGRLYSRIFVKKWLGIDDGMCVLALIFTIATTVVVVLANVHYDWNRHIWDIPWDRVQSANIIAFVAKLTFTLAATFTRLSLICFYYRLIKDSGITWFNWVLHASVVWTLSVCLVFIVLTVWLCNPVKAYWIFPPLPNGRCLDEGKVMLGGGVINSVSDLLTTVLPIPIVLRLQMPLKQRIGVCILLCLGFIVTIAGSIRTYYTWKSLLDSWDETWYAYPLWIAAAVEIDLGLVGQFGLLWSNPILTNSWICSCAPAWKSLLAQPIRDLSSKISSLRSPSNSPDSSAAARPSIFTPLQSLARYQITKLGFERTQREPDEYALQDIETGSNPCISRPSRDQSEDIEDAGGRDFRLSDIVDDAARPRTPHPHITVRRSFDQHSTRINDSPVMPGEWLSDGGSTRSSPRH